MVFNQLIKSGIIAVVRKINPTKTLYVIDSLVKGGITGVEITVDSENAFALMKEVKEKYGSDVIVGAGTVLNETAASKAIEAGAEFIFAPTLNKETIVTAKKHGKIAIPGVMTPTEIIRACEWGADAVKIFPASVLGSTFIKEVKAPLRDIPIIPTGGIDLENVVDYIRAGASAIGVGSSLLNKQYVEDNKWQALTDVAKQFVEIVQYARG
ncbi:MULTISPECIES: bifunctional 4-hydroxy-2-oxoglutarate aldolase/2-dehydro-3-deoxy-phosphogluconate aldolase [Clostridia]|uniref:bifunctional 4-hydroxy-2-oxoglutarate aldolase/2-dehydro-3-deoxy-phosphogluconate aldolase n=1 Tax=Clostridia TaxID=186801 RepID=UPI000EA0209A|nr:MULTISPECIES: bifunctional 4-hydroxy-2-oxoglutarate aldolase/2-dehydro-3-deoxy-phosphogluconate aldolase [Clostridia]NBJ71616.1 bifunctional 4-hydroxy-2-oxoglutarate aldolase/2-dehydro-3-deoxy-phosphogluconate aldolase [Roseburia sp. 1XD42-34]RKI76849.1 bifunctional 4-hydroxy-2-oxoglutarate aldolase/2-dehydro-3-deoxy-phosphogluconate aldolase [Clostridium sp. 1xD42-85]